MTVEVLPYDPDWVHTFETERAGLASVFAGVDAQIEHVGSTSVPGAWAKPIIDISIGCDSLFPFEERIGDLEALGYEYVPEYEQQIPDRRYFRKPAKGTAPEFDYTTGALKSRGHSITILGRILLRGIGLLPDLGEPEGRDASAEP